VANALEFSCEGCVGFIVSENHSAHARGIVCRRTISDEKLRECLDRTMPSRARCVARVAAVSRNAWRGMKSNQGGDAKQGRDDQDQELRELEWRFGLGRCQRMQGRNLFK
jgi:hypothetical protein